MAYTANIIPTMTSNTAPSGVASASSVYSASYPAWKAFDHGAGDGLPWRSAGTTGQLGYQVPTPLVVTRYAITTRGVTGISRAPKTWTFQGSNNGSDWVTLDAQTNIADTEWATINGVRRVFDFANTTAYAYYRLDISASNNATALSVGELEMMVTYVSRRSIGSGIGSGAVTAPRLSLLVGSDALGWADLGGSAVIGERTKGMPGGDGSLSFTLPPDVAAKARNQLQHKARVKLTANGTPDFGGRICSDPFGDVLSPVKDAITVECSGLWAWADRYGAFAWVWNDSDTAQWTTTSQIEGASELVASDAEAAKYTADTQGRLFILANSNEAFAAASVFPLGYWLLGGLETGCVIVGLDVTYMCNLPVLTAGGAPGPWDLMFTAADSPWSSSFGWLNSPGGTTTHSSWFTQSFDISPGLGYRFVQAYLLRNSGNAGPINEVVSDPWVWVGSVIVRCRMDGETVDRTVYLSDVLRDMATKPGLATVTAGEVISLGAGNNQMAVRSMTSIRSGMVDLASLYAGELEYWFDLDAAGNDRFNHHSKPAAADPTRNSVWSYGEAAGESVAGLDHDPELCPDWIRMTYLSDGVATIPNGTPRDVWYPATPPTDLSASVRVITEFAGQMFTDARAASVAERVHARIAASEWSGSVPIPFTMTDVAGRERGGWQVTQGDRLSVPSLDGADDLYITEVSWNWTSMTGSATVGYPWEVTGMLGTEAAAIAPFVDPNGKVDTAIVDTDPWKNWR